MERNWGMNIADRNKDMNIMDRKWCINIMASNVDKHTVDKTRTST